MSSFKYKPEKIKYVSNIDTLDELHQQHVKEFNDLYVTVESKKEELKKLKNQMLLYEKKDKSKFDFADIKQKAIIKENIETLEKEINDIDHKTTELDYYSKTNDILFEYFDIIDTSQYKENNLDNIHKLDQNNTVNTVNTVNTINMNSSNKLIELNMQSQKKRKIKKPTRKRIKNVEQKLQQSIMLYLMTDNKNSSNLSIQNNDVMKVESCNNDIDNDNSANSDDNNNIVVNISNNINMDNKENNENNENVENIKNIDNVENVETIENTSDIRNTEKNKDFLKEDTEKIIANRATLKDEYLSILDRSYVNNKFKKYTIRTCSRCNVELMLIQSEGSYVCQYCGETEHIIIESEVPNHKEAANEKPRYPYKRQNHAVEWLNQFQAKESTEIPEEIINNIIDELKRQKLYNKIKTLPFKKIIPIIKQIMKKLRYASYYEHITYIISKITEIPPPSLNRETEELLKNMFKQTQGPFAKYCPKNRINFLNYAYIFNKLFRLLELEEYADRIPLLKSREKLREQDIVWKKICMDLEWNFHASI